ncbi:MAG: sigma-70 family RNA polymerase sigma factor [Planctomycetes bacterium]|nr:sigma-70 family RNA polymerase sigma factor [Planctomycetota bacterium]
MVGAKTTAAAISTLLQQKRVPAANLLPLLYDELRALARGRVAMLARSHTLRATDLVHEAWLRVVAGGDPGWDGRAHFFGAAANAMRNILVEQARRRSTRKRDASRKVELPTDLPELEAGLPYDDVLSVHEALLALEREHARPARVVELRFFGGLTMPDIAAMLDVSVPTVERDWRFARAWLQDRLGAPPSADG